MVVFSSEDQERIAYINSRVDSLAWDSACSLTGGGSLDQPTPYAVERALKAARLSMGLFEVLTQVRRGDMSVDEGFKLAQAAVVR